MTCPATVSAQGRARRDERGVTLVETLIALAVTFTLAMPLLAWMVTGLRTTASSERRSAETVAQNMLSSYLVRDGAAATAATPGGVDCAGRGTALVTLTEPGSDASTIVYVAVGGGDAPGSVWRRRCDAAGVASDDVELVERAVAPAGGWATAVTCHARAGIAGDACGVIELDVPVEGDQVVSASVVRRVGVQR